MKIELAGHALKITGLDAQARHWTSTRSRSRPKRQRKEAQAMSEESYVDAVVRRALAMGWKVDVLRERGVTEWADVTTPSGGSLHYSSWAPGCVGRIEPACIHERALLERDGSDVEAVRQILGDLQEIRARTVALEDSLHRILAGMETSKP
jgi:hypothetical protein